MDNSAWRMQGSTEGSSQTNKAVLPFTADFPGMGTPEITAGLPRNSQEVDAGYAGDGGDHEESKACSVKNLSPVFPLNSDPKQQENSKVSTSSKCFPEHEQSSSKSL